MKWWGFSLKKYNLIHLLIGVILVTGWNTSFSAPKSLWQPVAVTVCGQIDKANQAYQQGDLKNAHLLAIMAYFKGYDVELEPAVRVTLGGPHVFVVEGQFRDYATVMTPDLTAAQKQKVTLAATALCNAVKEDATALDKAQVARQVFKVE